MTFVFVHGLGQRAAAWDAVREQLPRELPVDCPELYSFLDREKTDYDTLYGAFSAHCLKLPELLHLCGLSLGGLLSLQFASEFPEKAASLTLIGTPCRMPRGLLRFQQMLFTLFPASFFGQTGLSKREFLRLTASMACLEPERFLTRVSCPSLILCGEKDRANQKAAALLTAGIPGAEHRLITHAGHEVNRDNPAALALELKRFYRQLDFWS